MTNMFINGKKISLKSHLNRKQYFTKYDYIIYKTLLTGCSPNDVEVDILFSENMVVPRIEIEKLIQNELHFSKNEFFDVSQIYQELDTSRE